MDAAPVVLLVEGDIVARHILAEYLRQCGFRVIEAAGGGEALLVLGMPELGIEVVLIDVATADGGFALRQRVRDRQFPVRVIMAGSTDGAVQQAGELCNDGPALTKPYEHHLVLDRIRQALARQA